MREIVYTDDEALKCPNPRCRSGFKPNRDGHCVDCGADHEWPDDGAELDAPARTIQPGELEGEGGQS